MKKHHLLFLNSTKFAGGGEMWMVRTAVALQQRGHAVNLVARRNSPLAAMAEKAGVRVHAMPMNGDLNPILLWRVMRVLQREDISISVANVPRDIRITALAKTFARRSKLIALHQVDKPLPNRWNYKLTFNSMADALVVNSHSTKKTLWQHNPWIKQQRIEVIYHGLKPTPHKSGAEKSLCQELRIPPNSCVLGFVGRLAEQKGVLPMLTAIASFFQENQHCHLVIAGTGELEKKVRAFISKNGLQDRVHLLGFRSDVTALMSEFDMLLVPSLWEGFGLVLIEAMSVGTPCIASRVSSIPEIVDHEHNGLLIEPGDSAQLLQALRRLQADRELLLRLGQAGREKVRAVFAETTMIANYERLFDDLCERSVVTR